MRAKLASAFLVVCLPCALLCAQQYQLISTFFVHGAALEGVRLKPEQPFNILWVAIVTVVIAFLAAHLIATRIQMQLEQLRRGVRRMAEGDFSGVAEPAGHDQIDQVIQAVNDVALTLRRSVVYRQHMHDILDSMKEGVLVTDLVGQVTYSNVVAQQLLEAGAPELLGVHVADLITARWQLEAGTLRARGEGSIRLAGANRREVVVERCHLRDQRGLLQGMMYTLEDVTERVALTRALADHRDMLARSERIAAVGTMGAIIAHKFSQPLSCVRLFLQQVRRELKKLCVPEQIDATLADALAELERIAALTRQVVQRGRSEVNHPADTESEVAQLQPAVVRVIESLRDAAGRRGVAVCAEPIDPSAALHCSPLELEEILYCLINNSIQAAPEGTGARVELSFCVRGDLGVLTVSDSCGGIASEHIDKIFECFFTTKGEGHGTGLGLAIVRHVVERRRGRVDLSNAAGVGSCFTISLPLAHVPGSESDTSDGPAVEHSLREQI